MSVEREREREINITVSKRKGKNGVDLDFFEKRECRARRNFDYWGNH